MADAKLLRVLGLTSSNGFSAVNVALDASGDKLAFIFQPYTTDPITHLGFRYGARTGTPPTYTIGLQGVGATGVPDGTYVGGGTPASMTFTPPADASIDGLWQWKALANSYAPTRGQMLAAPIEYSSGTIDGSNNSSFTRNDGNSQTDWSGRLPYHATNTVGTYSKSALSVVFGWRTASGRYGRIAQSQYTTAAATTGLRQAMHFTLPSGWGDTFSVIGARMRLTTISGSVKLALWDASSELQSLSLDVEHQGAMNSGVLEFIFSDAALDALSFGTKYYIGAESVSNSSISLRGIQLAEADDRIAFPAGDIRGLSTYDGASWSDDNTVMPQVELLLSDWTEPSGGAGGMIVHPGMSGGLRG